MQAAEKQRAIDARRKVQNGRWATLQADVTKLRNTIMEAESRFATRAELLVLLTTAIPEGVG